MPPKETLWEITPHTEAKHEILRRYINAWYPILGSWNKRLVYLDAFAGPGEYVGGEDGSPIIALDSVLQHRASPNCEVNYFFIEKRDDRANHLKNLLEEYDLPEHINYWVTPGTFDEEIAQTLDQLDEKQTDLAPTLALLDPFGFKGVPLSIIRRIMSHEYCEVLITFHYESVNRFATHPDGSINQHYDQLFGTERWRRVADIDKKDDRRKFLHNLYRDQLMDQAEIEYVRSFEMRDYGNRTEYFLFFGTNGYTGLKKIKNVMWRLDPGEGKSFSDATVEEQMVIFEESPDFDRLGEFIRDWAGDEPVAVSDIERFTVTETPFAASHWRRALKPIEERGELEIVESTRKQDKAYPEGTVVRFTNS